MLKALAKISAGVFCERRVPVGWLEILLLTMTKEQILIIDND